MFVRWALRVEGDSATLWLQQAKNALDEFGLSTSVGADDAQEVAVVDSEVRVAQDGAAVLSGAEVGYFDEWLHSEVVFKRGLRGKRIK